MIRLSLEVKVTVMKSRKENLYYSFIHLVLISLATFFASAPVMANKSVYGFLEPVTLTAKQITLTAKLDTGAETASISAKDITLYEKDGREYVNFTVDHPELDEALDYSLPLVRHARIKKRASERSKDSTHHTRPVVNMQINFDGQPHSIMVNLIDRSHFSTPMLLGRKALEKLGAVIDSTQKNTLLEKTNS